MNNEELSLFSLKGAVHFLSQFKQSGQSVIVVSTSPFSHFCSLQDVNTLMCVLYTSSFVMCFDND